MTKVELNTAPYFDDYAESKKFYKILFRPGRALQARELTQVQSIIQNQIGRFGKHFFKNFALVSPRPSLGCKYDPTTVFVKITASAESGTENEKQLNEYWLNKKVRSQYNVEGLIIGYHKNDNDVRLFISLEKAGTLNGQTRNNFEKGDTISVDVENTLADGTTQTITLSAQIHDKTNSVGRIASVEIPDSVYFYGEYFVLVDRQWLFITPNDVDDDLAWNASPTCEIGIEMIESKITFEDDESLLDNANGTSNYAAPGSDRLRIEGTLTVKSINTTDQNFIRLLTVTNGIITKAWQLETDPYNDPYKAILAKRTFDESGNYTIKPFLAEPRPFLSTDNQGLFIEESLSVPYDPDDELSKILAQEKATKLAQDLFDTTKIFSHTKTVNGVSESRYYPGASYDDDTQEPTFKQLCDDRLGIRLQPGAAYVEGYFQEKPVITHVPIKKSRTSDFITNRSVQTPKGTYYLVTNVIGFPPIADVGNSNLSYGEIELHSTVLVSRTQTVDSSTKIGTARVYSIELYSGTNGSYNATYALGVFDVRFDVGYDATDVASIHYDGGATSGTFSANMVFKDITTNPSLRLTGTAQKYTSNVTRNSVVYEPLITTTNSTTTETPRIRVIYSTKAARDADYYVDSSAATLITSPLFANGKTITISHITGNASTGIIQSSTPLDDVAASEYSIVITFTANLTTAQKQSITGVSATSTETSQTPTYTYANNTTTIELTYSTSAAATEAAQKYFVVGKQISITDSVTSGGNTSNQTVTKTIVTSAASSTSVTLTVSGELTGFSSPLVSVARTVSFQSSTNEAAQSTSSNITLLYTSATQRNAEYSTDYTLGTILSITSNTVNSSGTKTITKLERTITSVTKQESPLGIAISLNEALPNTTSIESVSTIRKIKGLGTLWKTNLGEKLEKGDQVLIGTGDKQKVYTVYSDPANNNELNLEPDPTIATNVTWDDNSTITYLVSESVQDDSLGNAGLVYRLPHSDVRAVRGGNKNDPNYTTLSTNYVARRYIIKSGSTDISSTQITHTLSTDEKFELGISNYGLVDLNTGYWFQLFATSGSGINRGKAGQTSDADNDYRAELKFDGDNKIIFQLANIANITNARFGIIVAVEKNSSAAKERKKNLVKGSFSTTNNNYTGPVVTVANTDNKKISLGVPDVLRVTRIVESGSITQEPSSSQTLQNPHKDITFKYSLDNGQRDYYYGIASIELRPGYEQPKGQLRIEFDYFTHTEGDYFSVDSYPWNINTLATSVTVTQMTYDEIPDYFSEKHGKYDLRACLDFRPVCITASLSGTGQYRFSKYKELPLQNVNCSYHVWEERRDKIYINNEGVIKVKYGVPGIIAETPNDPVDGMTLYDVQMLPYTEDYRNCILKMVDNRRYTMRDIAKLENRVKKLEYYTTLSLLEKDTNDLVVKDALGQDKFKHGFMVDNFANESVADVNHPDFTAALDKISGELKPRVAENHIRVSADLDLGYNKKETGGLLTLDYTNISYLEQSLASRLINVNPYQVQTFMGTLKITPWTDTWRETSVADPLIVYDTSAYDFARQNYNSNGERIDWQGTRTDWQGVSNTQTRSSDIVLAAGHSWPATDGRYLGKDGQLINGSGKPKKGQFVIVPPGFANSGQIVKYEGRGSAQENFTTTTSMNGEKYATGIKSTIVDSGFSAPVSMGSRMIDTRAAEYIRSSEIKFEGKCFLPNSKLYAYFDGVDVSNYCVPDINYGTRLETPASVVRGPFSALSVKFKNNTVVIEGDKSSPSTDQLSSKNDDSDSITNVPNGRGKTLAGLTYDSVIANTTGELPSDKAKLSQKVKLLQNASSTDITVDGVVIPGGNYYLLGDTNSKFKTELIAKEGERSVLLIDDLNGQYQVQLDGIKSNTVALVDSPYIPSGATNYVMVSTDNSRDCVDLLEILQKLYVSKYVDISTSADVKYNILNKQIKAVRYDAAKSNQPKATLTLDLDESVKLGEELSDSTSVKLNIKHTTTDKDINPPGPLSMICDSTGSIKGKFVIPDPRVDGKPKFRTGDRVFRLTNSPKNEDLPTVSRADAKYSATGWIDTKQDQLYSTKQFRIDQQYVEGERTPVTLQDSFQSAGKVCPRDPLAQTFNVSEPTGIFLTALDVFFYSKDPTLPLILQIRPLDDGGNPSIKYLYEMVMDAKDVVVNKINLIEKTITVIGNTIDGTPGFNAGPWSPDQTVNSNVTGIRRVLSANQASGIKKDAIVSGQAFPFTVGPNQKSLLCDDMIPTRFVFDYPVYLPGNNSNYCFVLLSDSIQAAGTGVEALEATYQVYMAQTGFAPVTKRTNTPDATPVHLLKPLEDGEDDVNLILGTSDPLNATNSTGVLLKSIDSITWESDQRADLKFNLFRAKFETSTNGEIHFVNDKLPLSQLIIDPFETIQGQSAVRVYHRNHNIPEGGYVRFIGLPKDDETNGIPYQYLGREDGHKITSPTLDSYVIDLDPFKENIEPPTREGTNIIASATGRIGGRTVLASSNIRFEEFLLRTNPIVLPETELNFKVVGITAKAAYDPESTPWQLIDETDFSANTDTPLAKSAMVCSVIEEQKSIDSLVQNKIGANTSLKVIASMTSTSDYVSPVLDQERMGIDTKSVRLDNPVGTGVTYNNINSETFDNFVCLPTTDSPAVSSSTLSGKLYFSDTDNKLTGSSFIFDGKKVTGVGSLFTVELNVGDEIKHPMLDDIRRVAEITSDTEIYLNEEFPLSDISEDPEDYGGSQTLLYNPPFLRIKTADDSVAVHLSKLDVGKYIKIEGTLNGKRDISLIPKKILAVNYTKNSQVVDAELTQALGQNSTCKCEVVIDHRFNESLPGLESGDTTDPLTITQLNNYIDEIAPSGGSCASKYVTKIMRLPNAANTLKIMFDGCRPKHSQIELYYKVSSNNEQELFDQKNWTKLEYSVENNGVLEYVTPAENSSQFSFSEYEGNVLGLPPFTMARIKVVLRGGHTPLYPKIKNLRIIALEE